MRYLHPVHHHPARIRKIGEIFEGELDFRVIKFLVKIRDIHKVEKKNCIEIGVFGFKTSKNIQSICQELPSKNIYIYYS